MRGVPERSSKASCCLLIADPRTFNHVWHHWYQRGAHAETNDTQTHHDYLAQREREKERESACERERETEGEKESERKREGDEHGDN